jgi:hypothetical protein
MAEKGRSVWDSEPFCLMCGMEKTLRDIDRALRHQLRRMNPTTDPNYQRYFDCLVSEDQTLRILRDAHHEDKADA